MNFKKIVKKQFFKNRLGFIFLLLIILNACNLPGATPTPGTREFSETVEWWYVATDGNDTNSCSALLHPCLTIQAAVDKAEDRGADVNTIYVGTGTFGSPIGIEALVTVTIDITIEGEGSRQTILDGGGSNAVILVRGVANVVLRDVTVQNGGEPESFGTSGGINIQGNASMTIEDTIISSNSPSGISASGTGNLNIRNVISQDNQEQGMVSGLNTSIISSNFIGNGEYGVVIGTTGILNMSGGRVEENNYGGIMTTNTSSFDSITISNNGVGGSYGCQCGLFIDGPGIMTVSEATINNHPSGPGISIADSSATLEISTSLIEGNYGSGIKIRDGSATLTRVTVRNNGAWHVGTSFAGGIFVNPGNLTLVDSEINDNRNGGIGINGLASTLNITNSTISGNLDPKPGIHINDATTVICCSTISNNEGKGIEKNSGIFSMGNSTISGNGDLGVQVFGGSNNFSYTTIAYNLGGGIAGGDTLGTSTLFNNMLLVDNGGRDCGRVRGAEFSANTASVINLDSDDTCGFEDGVNDLLIAPLSVSPPGPGPDAYITATHALLEGSPAIDAAPSLSTSAGCPVVDQRGAIRPVGLGCDIGAYESEFESLIDFEDIEEISDSDVSEDDFATATPEVDPTGVALQNASCREGADASFEVLNFLLKEQSALLIGRILDDSWFYVELPNDLGQCWIFSVNLALSGPVEKLPYLIPPELPLPESSGDDNTATPPTLAAPIAPTAPSNLSFICKPGFFEFTLSWNDNSNNEDGFKILKGGSQVGSVAANVISFIYDPSGSNVFTYTVESYNSGGSASVSINNVACLP